MTDPPCATGSLPAGKRNGAACAARQAHHTSAAIAVLPMLPPLARETYS
ncbi:hypothetical protein ACQ4WP_12080 [Janthinobacterium sp. GB4P2]